MLFLAFSSKLFAGERSMQQPVQRRHCEMRTLHQSAAREHGGDASGILVSFQHGQSLFYSSIERVTDLFKTITSEDLHPRRRLLQRKETLFFCL